MVAYTTIAVLANLLMASGCALRPAGKLIGHRQGVTTLWLSNDARLIVSGGADGQVLVWESASRRCLSRHLPYGGCLDFAQPGEPRAWRDMYAFRSPDGRAQTWAPVNLTIHWAGLSRDGSRVIAVTARDIVVWDRRTGRELARLAQRHGRRTRRASCDGRFVLRVLEGRHASATELWDLEHRRRIATLQTTAAWLTPATASTPRLAYGHDGALRLAALPEMKQPVRLSGPTADLRAACFSSNGTRLAVLDAAAALWIWDIPGAQVLLQIPVRDRPTNKPLILPSVVLSGDGTRVAASDGRTVAVCDLSTGRTQRIAIPKGPPVRLVAVRNDGCALAVSQAHALRDDIWFVDPGTGRLARQGSQADKITATAARGNLLVTGSSANKSLRDASLRAWRWSGSASGQHRR